MKKLLSIFLALLLPVLPSARPQIVPAFCYVTGGALVILGIRIMIKRCAPKYYCVHDPATGANWCLGTTPRQIALSGWTQVGGPWDQINSCAAVCSGLHAPANLLTIEDYVQPYVHIWSSPDLVHWTFVTEVSMDITDDFQTAYEEPATERQKFFKVEVFE